MSVKKFDDILKPFVTLLVEVSYPTLTVYFCSCHIKNRYTGVQISVLPTPGLT